MTTAAIGLELSTDTDMAAVAVAGREGERWLAEVMWYGSPDDAVAECSRLYAALEDNCGVFADPQPCAGILDALKATGVWLHLLEFTDVGAAAWQFVTEARGRRLKLGKHPALRESMRAAVPRPLAVRFAFERKRVNVDMSPLNACAFALWGLRKNESVSEPGAWLVQSVGGTWKAPPGWAKTRQRVFARYGHVCWRCGGYAGTVDHVIPVVLGGSHDLSNLRPCCARDNSSTGASVGNRLRPFRPRRQAPGRKRARPGQWRAPRTW